MTGYPTRRNTSLAQPGVDLRGLLMPVINQELRPLCLPVSVSAAHEAGRTAPPDQLAPDALWTSCAAAGLTTAEGTTLTAVAQALTTDGQPTLTNWPYNATLGPHAEPPPTSATSADWYLAEMIDVPLAHDGIEDPIEDVLATGNCVVLVLEVTDEFQDATTDGTIAVPPLNAPTGAYHAVLVVDAAADDASSSATPGARDGEPEGSAGYPSTTSRRSAAKLQQSTPPLTGPLHPPTRRTRNGQ